MIDRCPLASPDVCRVCVHRANCTARPQAPRTARQVSRATTTPPGALERPTEPPRPAAPVLGVDPGTRTGLAVVRGREVLASWSLDWGKAGTWDLLLDRVLEAYGTYGARHAIVETLGPVKGGMRGMASSWCTMGECCGRVLQELDRAGFTVERLTPAEWRGRLGLPASWGKGTEKDRAAKRYAKDLLELEGVSSHVAEAALMATAGNVTTPG